MGKYSKQVISRQLNKLSHFLIKLPQKQYCLLCQIKKNLMYQVKQICFACSQKTKHLVYMCKECFNNHNTDMHRVIHNIYGYINNSTKNIKKFYTKLIEKMQYRPINDNLDTQLKQVMKKIENLKLEEYEDTNCQKRLNKTGTKNNPYLMQQ